MGDMIFAENTLDVDITSLKEPRRCKKNSVLVALPSKQGFTNEMAVLTY